MSFSVIITAASRRVALVKSFKNALKGTNGKVIAVDYDMYSSALFFADEYYKVPLVNDKDYISSIQKIAQKENVKLVIPTIDQELLLWSEVKESFEEIGISVSISPKDTIKICGDKLNTYDFFVKNGLPFPESFDSTDLPDNLKFPLFIKPRMGRGSVDSIQINDWEDLNFHIKKISDPIISEFLEGDEFTTDALFSKDGKLLRCVHRYRLVVRAGVSDRGKTFKNVELTEYIVKIGNLLKLEGAINIQGKIKDKTIKFFEINPRYSGGIQLTIASGVNFAKILIDELKGKNHIPDLYNYDEGIIMTSFEDSLFLDQEGNISKIQNYE